MMFGRVNASARKIVSGYWRRTSAIIHSQKWNDLVCGLSTRKMRTPRAHQNSIDALQLLPEAAPRGALEVDRVDVLVFLRRVLRVLDRAVRPMPEPFRMLAHPGMIRRALIREVERDLEPVAARRRDEMIEVVERAERRVDRHVAAGLAADRPWAAHIVGCGVSVLLRALAMRVADWMDGRQVQDVEPHRGDPGQRRFGLAECRARGSGRVPPERGNISYQAPKRARSRSTSTESTWS